MAQLFPPFKGTSSLPAKQKEKKRKSEETSKVDADTKRRASLKRKIEEFQQEKTIISTSLSNVSAKKPGHIRFDADDEPNCSANEQINPTDHEDRRFQMDQRFEGDDELDQENSEFPTDDLEAETERNRQILAKVLSSHSVEEKKEEMTTETKSFVVDDEFAKELRKKAEKTETEIKPFSLLAAFGRNAVEKEEKLVEQPKIIGKPYESHQKFETDAAPVQQPVKKRSDPAKFFFTPNDPRILSAIKVFRRTEELDAVRKRWAKFRPGLVLNSKKNAKIALRQKKQKANTHRRK